MAVHPPGTYARVRHYYGDTVRMLFIIVALLSLAITPRIGSFASPAALFLLGLAIAFIVLAALTNPRSKTTLILDAIVSVFGLALFVPAAVDSYTTQSTYLTVMETIAAALCLFALYFSVKTIRTMAMHMIGKEPRAGEFAE